MVVKGGPDTTLIHYESQGEYLLYHCEGLHPNREPFATRFESGLDHRQTCLSYLEPRGRKLETILPLPLSLSLSLWFSPPPSPLSFSGCLSLAPSPLSVSFFSVEEVKETKGSVVLSKDPERRSTILYPDGRNLNPRSVTQVPGAIGRGD